MQSKIVFLLVIFISIKFAKTITYFLGFLLEYLFI